MNNDIAVYCNERSCSVSATLWPRSLVTGVILGALMFCSNDAAAAEKEKYAFLSVISPGAQQITIADTARLDDVLEVLRAANVVFEGPVPVVVTVSGEPRTVAYKLTVRLDTYNPRGATDPGCPYQQVTELTYDLEGRLYVYYVSYQAPCVK